MATSQAVPTAIERAAQMDREMVEAMANRSATLAADLMGAKRDPEKAAGTACCPAEEMASKRDGRWAAHWGVGSELHSVGAMDEKKAA
jgi:hypothetical protein